MLVSPKKRFSESTYIQHVTLPTLVIRPTHQHVERTICFCNFLFGTHESRYSQDTWVFSKRSYRPTGSKELFWYFRLKDADLHKHYLPERLIFAGLFAPEWPRVQRNRIIIPFETESARLILIFEHERKVSKFCKYRNRFI